MYILYAFLIGVVGAAALAVLGAITTREFEYSYSYLLPFQFALYTLTGYIGSNGTRLNTALICAVLVGVFDATIGWDLWIKFNPDLIKDERVSKSTVKDRLMLMIGFSLVFGFLGYLLA